MKWDENGIAVCESPSVNKCFELYLIIILKGSFYRAAIPKDITEGSPDPSQWGNPSAALESTGCNPLEFFYNHSIVFGESCSTVLLSL